MLLTTTLCCAVLCCPPPPHTQVSIDEDTFKALEAVAKAEGKSISHVAAERLQQL
jgi:hypothetical protein